MKPSDKTLAQLKEEIDQSNRDYLGIDDTLERDQMYKVELDDDVKRLLDNGRLS